MLLLFVALAVFVAWSWLSYPAVGHWLYDLNMAIEAKLYKLHKIEVPIADPARVQSVAATIEQKVPNLIGGKLIIVIDDEESVRLGMQSLLESWGCKCIAAMDSAEVLQSIDGRSPDFIIADLRLRGESTGIDAIRELRAQLGNQIPAVLISGDTATEQLRKVSAAGLTMMHKPLKAVRLRALLNHEFAKRIA